MPAITSKQTESYYKAAILGLRALEAREGLGRRFGAEADARWERFRGKLHEGDRLHQWLEEVAAISWRSRFTSPPPPDHEVPRIVRERAWIRPATGGAR